MLQHGHQHRGDAQHRGAAVGVEQLQDQARIEGLHQHESHPLRDAAEDAQHAAAGVEQRHRADPHRPVADPHPVGRVGPVVYEPPVEEQSALREAGGSRRVLDHAGVHRVGVDQVALPGVAVGQEGLPLIQAYDLPEFRALGLHLGGRGQHRVAAELGEQDQPCGARLGQYVLQLAGLEGRVHGHEDHAGHGAAELQDHPLRNVGGPDGHPLAHLEVRPDGTGRPFGIGQQLRVCPLPPVVAVGGPGDEGHPVRHGGGHLP